MIGQDFRPAINNVSEQNEKYSNLKQLQKCFSFNKDTYNYIYKQKELFIC